MVELNIFRCPYQTAESSGTQGSCLGQVRLNATDMALNATNLTNATDDTVNGTSSSYAALFGDGDIHATVEEVEIRWSNHSMCASGYAGSLCGACDVGYVMTGNGCIVCESSGMGTVFMAVGGATIFLILMVLIFRYVKRRAQADEYDPESEIICETLQFI